MLALKLTICGYFLVAALHIVGLVLLHRAKAQMLNQRMILLNLSVAEMLFCLFEFFKYLNELFWSSWTCKFVIDAFNCIVFCAVRLSMFHFIVDRFLDIWLNLRYPLYFNKKILKILIISQWIFGFLCVVVLTPLFIYNVIGWYTVIIVRLSMDIIIVIAALLTFPYLFGKVKKAIHVNNNNPKRKLHTWIKMRVPILMIITFIAFNTSYSIILYYRSSRNIHQSYTFQMLDIFGWGSDVFIYVLLQKRVRCLMFSSCRKANRNQVGDICLHTYTSSIW